MRSLIILRPVAGVTLDQFMPLLVEEEKTLWGYLQSGAVRSINYAADHPGTIVLDFETETADQARTLAEQFPIAQAGLFEIEVLGLAPYQGLAALFDPAHAIPPQLPAAWMATLG